MTRHERTLPAAAMRFSYSLSTLGWLAAAWLAFSVLIATRAFA